MFTTSVYEQTIDGITTIVGTRTRGNITQLGRDGVGNDIDLHT